MAADNNARALALSLLDKCEKNGQYSNIALDNALRSTALSPADRALATTLFYGVLERRITLDCQISHLCDRDGEIEPTVRNLLRLGLYQLIYLDRIPDHAAVDETVSLAPRRARGFVNALLRSFVRGGKRLSLPDREQDAVAYLSVRYSVGEPLCRRFLDALGEDEAEALLSAFHEHPALTLRVNTQKTTREELLSRLCAQGLSAEPTLHSPYGIHVRSGASVRELAGYDEGHFFVQDEASQLCALALDARPDMEVLDTCACPGSKTFGIALQMQNRGSLTSCDLHASKLSLIRSGAERLGLSCIDVLQKDAREHRPDWVERFDRILCDVPCSGFGVLAKKPELRYKDPTVSDSLPDIQLEILKSSFAFLKKGGGLVYSTCTVLPAENEENVARFLSSVPNARPVQQKTYYPHTDHTDGFFVAVLEKI